MWGIVVIFIFDLMHVFFYYYFIVCLTLIFDELEVLFSDPSHLMVWGSGCEEITGKASKLRASIQSLELTGL